MKRILDLIISAIGIVILSIPMLVLVEAIKLDSPGPVLFKQKRVGIHKTHFNILKFRTMRIDTPKDMPTHMLENPERQWVSKLGLSGREAQTKCKQAAMQAFARYMQLTFNKAARHGIIYLMPGILLVDRKDACFLSSVSPE